MIVGTAGHIDHGKTTLVKALTGTDTDRLPEEKRRGISIALGYAFLPVEGAAPLGIVDVPGHERLVHTMLAGATGIDLALLLVAADDGPMPQTREHLAVLSLLGIARSAVVITKADRADAARQAAVQAEATALLAGTPLAQAPQFTVSAHTGQGVAALRHWLQEQARAWPPAADDGRGFRLAVDRSFTLDGVGTVATGTVVAGQVAAGALLSVVPGGMRVRVRSVHAQGQAAAAAFAGQRCALALAGTPREAVPRGHWLVGALDGDEAAACASTRLDLQLQVWRDAPHGLRSGMPVQVHLGAAAVAGTLAVLAPGDRLAPGASGWVQMVLRQPLGAWHGDRVVLRDAAATATLAGGQVLDPQAPARYRRTPARLAELAAWQQPRADQRLQALLATAAHGLDLPRWRRAEGLPATAQPPLEGAVLAGDDGALALAAARAQALEQAALQALARFHAEAPDELGPDAARLRRLAAPRLPDALWRALLARLQAAGRLARRGSFVHLPQHGLQLSATESRLAECLAPVLAAAGYEGAWVRDLARRANAPEALVRSTLASLARRGELHQVVRDLYYPPATIDAAAGLVRGLAATRGELRAAAFRDATGLGRKRAIQILEYFDRVGLTRRVGDAHRLRSDGAALGIQNGAQTGARAGA